MLLAADDLVKQYGRRRVLDGVSLAVGGGEVVGLLGRNGAGKTTTFRICMGLLRPEHGRVRLKGREITRLPVFRRARLGLGYLAQEPAVFQRMTVEENLLAVLDFLEPRRRRRKERARKLLEEFELEPLAGQQAHTLSGGETRRLEIARAMIREPVVILLDEPFSGLDPISVSDLHGLIRGLKERGIGVLLTDHNVRDTLAITDRSYIMDQGRVLCEGPPSRVVSDPVVRARYLGEGFRL